jgi:ubiquinone biosynthesis protein UbiJ
MLDGQVADLVNHLLARADWARETLRPFGGAVVAVAIGPVSWRLAITAAGLLAAADADTPPALRVTLDPFTAARLAAGETAVRAAVHTEGDDALARAVWHVATHLRWDFEADLAGLTGDVLAHRVASGLRRATRSTADSIHRAGLALAEYLTEEGGHTPPRHELAAFCEDVDATRDAVERLVQRIAALERGAGGCR